MKSKIESIVLSCRDYYGTYHHHKENMAWVATALYVAGMIGLCSYASKATLEWYDSLIITILLLIICYISVLFVYYQLKNKAIAADMVAACSILIFQLVGSQIEIGEEDIAIPENELFPAFLERERIAQRQIARSGRELKDSLNLFCRLRVKDLKSQEIFECAMIGSILLVTLLSFLALWIPSNARSNQSLTRQVGVLEHRVNQVDSRISSESVRSANLQQELTSIKGRIAGKEHAITSIQKRMTQIEQRIIEPINTKGQQPKPSKTDQSPTNLRR